MILAMARPWKHPKTGVYWFRRRVPARLLTSVGKREEKRSLRTKDLSEAKATRTAGQSRRLLTLAEIYDGGSRTKAARVGGVGLQTVRDWVVRFNAHGPEGLLDGKAPGNGRRGMSAN